ncbi:hypothetical protein [Pseudarthrobacter chlorophenolicus]|uniref:hypothetical protein n=1 Tax=Pseudarthrobacter chlorophenolicus TaxID=85085 RepID=UPI0005F27D19|nr:hypothetical protein [Pseudarthrobacter chlorophenolicus]
MTEKRFYWYLILSISVLGGINFLIKIVSGDTAGDAAIGTVIYVFIIGLMFLFLVRRRRKTLRKLAEKGQIECYIRRPQAPKSDRYRKWNIGLVTPSPGTLTFQPVLGRTSIARGEPFNIRIQATSGPRYAATKWDKFNRLEANALVLPLQTDEGPVDVAARAATLDRIEASLAGTEHREARN